MELLNVGLDNTHNLFWPDLHKHFFWQKSILLVVQLGKRAVENVTKKILKSFLSDLLLQLEFFLDCWIILDTYGNKY